MGWSRGHATGGRARDDGTEPGAEPSTMGWRPRSRGTLTWQDFVVRGPDRVAASRYLGGPRVEARDAAIPAPGPAQGRCDRGPRRRLRDALRGRCDRHDRLTRRRRRGRRVAADVGAQRAARRPSRRSTTAADRRRHDTRPTNRPRSSPTCRRRTSRTPRSSSGPWPGCAAASPTRRRSASAPSTCSAAPTRPRSAATRSGYSSGVTRMGMTYSLISQADLDVIGFQEFEEVAVRPVPVTRRLALGRLPRPVPRPRLDPRLDRLAHRRVEAGRGQQHRDPLFRRRPDPAPGHQAREHRVGPGGVVLQHPQPRRRPRRQRALARCRGQHPDQARQRARRRRHPGRVHRRLQRPRRGVLPHRRGAPSWRPPTAAATPAAATRPTGWTSTGSSARGWSSPAS